MTIQTTFRSVGKPRVKLLTSALAGGQLILDQATMFIFSGAAVDAVTSLVDHEYLIDGQPITFANAHPTNPLNVTIGSFSKSIPAGYGLILYFDEANASFYPDRRDANFKPVEDNIAANAAAITAEQAARIAEDLTFVKLNGSRPMTGNLNVDGNFVVGLPAATQPDHAVQKAQLDQIVATIEAAMSAAATSLQWRSRVQYITKFVNGNIPANGDALFDSNFGSGANRLFEDDNAPIVATTASISTNAVVVFLKDGQEPKRMIVRDVLGTKRWYDHTEVDPALKLDRALAVGDTFIVEKDLVDEVDEQESQAIYHVEAGTPKSVIKIADLNWEFATGISLASGYLKGPGAETVVAGDSLQLAISKLDGNLWKLGVDTAANLAAAIAQEVSDRNSAIAAAIAQEVADRNSAIESSQNAQNNKLASTSANEGASLIGLVDADDLYVASTVEGALREAREHINTAEQDIVALETDVANHTTQITQNSADISELYALDTQHKADLASTSFGKGASLVSVHDAGNRFAQSNLEKVLEEIDDKVEALNLVNMRRGLYEAPSTGLTSLNLAVNFVDQLVGGIVQDLSGATYTNAFVNRDGAMLIGGVGYTISGSTITFTAAGGGELIEGEVVEIKIIDIT